MGAGGTGGKGRERLDVLERGPTVRVALGPTHELHGGRYFHQCAAILVAVLTLSIACGVVYSRLPEQELADDVELQSRRECTAILRAAVASHQVAPSGAEVARRRCKELAKEYAGDFTGLSSAVLYAANSVAQNQRVMPMAPPAPEAPLSPPQCDDFLPHAQVDYFRQRFCEFGTTQHQQVEHTTEATPAQLAAAAYLQNYAAHRDQVEKRSCRSLVGGASQTRFAIFLARASAALGLDCATRVYVGDPTKFQQSLAAIKDDTLNHGGKRSGLEIIQKTLAHQSATVKETVGAQHVFGQVQRASEVHIAHIQETPIDVEICVAGETDPTLGVRNNKGFCDLGGEVLIVRVSIYDGQDKALQGMEHSLQLQLPRVVIVDVSLANEKDKLEHVVRLLDVHNYVVYMVGHPRAVEAKQRSTKGMEPMLLRVDKEWLQSELDYYRAMPMVATLMAVAPTDPFNIHASKQLMVCNTKCECAMPTDCNCKVSGADKCKAKRDPAVGMPVG